MPKTVTPAAKAQTARKAAAPAKKTTPRASKAPAKTTAVEAPPATNGSGRPVDAQGRPAIEFRGRIIPVVRPTDEQLGVWARTAQKLEALGGKIDAAPAGPARQAAVAEAARRATGMTARLSSIAHSVMVDEADRDWLDDQMMRGRDDPERVTYEQAFDVVRLAVDRLGQARTSGPARLRP